MNLHILLIGANFCPKVFALIFIIFTLKTLGWVDRSNCVLRPRDRQVTEGKDNTAQGFSAVHRGGLAKRLYNAGVDRQD